MSTAKFLGTQKLTGRLAKLEIYYMGKFDRIDQNNFVDENNH